MWRRADVVSIIVFATFTTGVLGEREHETHGSPSGRFRSAHEGPAGHDVHLDHQAVLGLCLWQSRLIRVLQDRGDKPRPSTR